MARVKKMSSSARSDSRADQLKNLSIILADQIDKCRSSEDGYVPPALSKEYREVIREIEDIEGVADEDGISEILSERKAEGKSNTVR